MYEFAIGLGSIVILISCVAQGALAIKYSSKNSAKFSGALARAILWSLITCWTPAFGVGHGPGIIPLPSWFAIFGLSDILGSKDLFNFLVIVRDSPVLNPVLTPLVPIMTYLVVFTVAQRSNS